jgi:hypothetical protein
MFLKPTAIAAGCMIALVSFDARAFPASVFPLEPQSFITQVAGGCGLGWHRGPLGRLPAQLGADCPPLLVSANALGPRRVCRW